MKKALILIDYINEICHADGKFASCVDMIKENNITTKVNNLLDKARKNGDLIIWVIVGFDKNYLEASSKSPIFNFAKSVAALKRGTWGTELLAELDYQAGELIICKNSLNPFYNTNLDHILRSNGVEEVYLAGVSTDVAVQSCTRDAHDRGYVVNVIGDCCASGNLEHHNASLEMLAAMANITTAKEAFN